MIYEKCWNWQQKDWPHFVYDKEALSHLEQEFLQNSGVSVGVFKHLGPLEQEDLKIELIREEALNTSKIEGEILNRESLQSSIQRQFGLKASKTPRHPAEEGIAEMMVDLYLYYEVPLTHEILWEWHKMLLNGRRDIHDLGCYRTQEDPMQVISGPLHEPRVHFEAPSSKEVPKEMNTFITWFNRTAPMGKNPLPPLERASITHLYFESIHPFEDGNGRIGRALVEKVLAQHSKKPTLISLSQIINNHRKNYYETLEKSSKGNPITEWMTYFSKTILEAQNYTLNQMEFLIKKAKFFDQFKDQMNPRQTKVVARMLKEGCHGFKGELSAENYIRIAQTSASTATRDLQDLIEKGILTRTGALKSTRYSLSL